MNQIHLFLCEYSLLHWQMKQINLLLYYTLLHDIKVKILFYNSLYSRVVNKARPIKKSFKLKMFENKNFKQHLNEFNKIMDQLNLVDIKFDDEVQALLILSQLLESWKGIIFIQEIEIGGFRGSGHDYD